MYILDMFISPPPQKKIKPKKNAIHLHFAIYYQSFCHDDLVSILTQIFN